ncbi:MAG: bifunctional riboflavin kinase/FAD synthetase [Firmicutes bacterium]|jgi:riboflavin kinase/FMN adenylyltransferase|nr:bifunctional riboflavin kinase/FAD synthetase [Bacillota bacterium]
MKIFETLDEVKIKQKTGIALGTFDGLHVGHKQVIRDLVENCKKLNLKSVVYTFSNHPREITKTSDNFKRLISLQEKKRLIEELGVDYLILVSFDEFHKNTPANEFVEEILIAKLRMRHLSVGFNYKFGKMAKGDINLLEEYSYKKDFSLSVISPVKVQGEKVSSTLIRELLEEGKVTEVSKYLGRNHRVTSKVISGKKVGRILGFATANLDIHPNMTLIRPGVYITRALFDGQWYGSISNVGYNPTFEKTGFHLETYIFDFDKDIYDQELAVEFLERIRSEKKFMNLDDLKNQIQKDVDIAKAYFEIDKLDKVGI